VNCAVIGLGPQGREMLAALAKLPNAPVAAICDTYTVPAFVKRAQDIAPNAKFVDDYRKALEDASVQAVFIATPSHRHKQIALDAIAAGKHVYCEAPLASDLAEAREIAKAGAAAKTVFQTGLQYRANKQHLHVHNFVRAGALGRQVVSGRGQWHKKMSWKRAASSPGRERELNWRLAKETSAGLMGEVGIHSLDVANWFLKGLPVAVSGFGSVFHWTNDGMEVPDTVQCLLEYPNGTRFAYDATLANSFDGSYELFLGADCAMLLRDQRAWMFKETDAPLLGWEVYARKDKLGVGEDTTATGIALVADATKLIKQGKQPGEVGTDVSKTALYQAIQAFLTAIRTEKKPAAGALEGYQATVTALKTHEAILAGNRILFQKEWFELS
jgi:predicted dehydrogenase